VALSPEHQITEGQCLVPEKTAAITARPQPASSMVMPSLPPAHVPPPATPSSAADDLAGRPREVQWAAIFQQLGAEIAVPLSAALARIQTLRDTGQIDRQGLGHLHDSVAKARAAGMLAQQLARLASGQIELAHEHLHLTEMLRSVVIQRSGETEARGIQVRQVLQPVEVMADGALLFALLNTMMDWALALTHSSIDLRLDFTPWPAQARLMCRFALRSLDLQHDPDAGAGDVAGQRNADELNAFNSLHWRLLEQIAVTLGVLPLRASTGGIAELTLDFAHTVGDQPEVRTRPVSLESASNLAPKLAPNIAPSIAPTHPPNIPQNVPQNIPSTAPPHSKSAPSIHSRPLAGKHLLVLTARRELRAQIQAAVQHLGLIVDAVETVGDAMQFCLEGLPHAIVFDADQRSAAFAHLHAEVMREVPDFSFVEVLAHEQQTQLSTATADGMARISRHYITDALPSVLMFELSRGH